MDYNFDESPDVVEIKIRLDENHLPDPITPLDVIVLQGAMGAVGLIMVTNLLIVILRRRARVIRLKNVPLILATSFASISHISAVCSNYILFVPQKHVELMVGLSGPDFPEMNTIDMAMTPMYCNTTQLQYLSKVSGFSSISYSENPPEGSNVDFGKHFLASPIDFFFEEGSICVLTHFWWEYFFGLSFYLALKALRLRITLIAQSIPSISLTHLRRKYAVRTSFVLLFLLPVYALNMYITTNELTQWTVFPIDFNHTNNFSGAAISIQTRVFVSRLLSSYQTTFTEAFLPTEPQLLSSREVDLVSGIDDGYYTDYCIIETQAVCETPLFSKLILILILLGYGIYMCYLALTLSRYSLDFGYSAAAIHSTYVCLVVLIGCAFLHFIHALNYWWGRCIFVSLVVFLHVFDYYRLIGGSLYVYFTQARCCCPEDEEVQIEMQEFKAMSKVVREAEIFTDKSKDQIDFSDVGVTQKILMNTFGNNLKECNRLKNKEKSSLSQKQQKMKHDSTKHLKTYEYLEECDYNKKLFYSFCIDNGRHKKYSYPMLLDKSTRDNAVQKNQQSHVEQIIGCIEKLSSFIEYIEFVNEKHEKEEPLSYAPQTLLLEEDVNFYRFSSSEQAMVVDYACTIHNNFFIEKVKENKVSLAIKSNYLDKFEKFYEAKSIREWDCDVVKNFRHLLRIVLYNEFYEDFFRSNKFELIEQQQQQAKEIALGTILTYLNEGMLSVEDHARILDEIDEEEGFSRLMQNPKIYKTAFENASSSIISADEGGEDNTPTFTQGVYTILDTQQKIIEKEQKNHDYYDEERAELLDGTENASDFRHDSPKTPSRNAPPSILRTIIRGPKVINEFAYAMTENNLTMDDIRGVGKDVDIMAFSLQMKAEKEEVKKRNEKCKATLTECDGEDEDAFLSDTTTHDYDLTANIVVYDGEYDEYGNPIDSSNRCCAYICEWGSWACLSLILYCDATDPVTNSLIDNLTHEESVQVLIKKYYGDRGADLDADAIDKINDVVILMRQNNSRQRKEVGYVKPRRLKNGSVVYKSVTSAFLHFLYHGYMWFTLPLEFWWSSNQLYLCLNRREYGRLFLNSHYSPSFLVKIKTKKREEAALLL